MKGGETAEEYKNRLRTLFVSKKIDPKSYSTH